MSFNGSGTFQINTAGQPVVSGTVISSSAFNALTADLATGLSTCITKDGQTTPTANIPMGNNKITGLAVGTAATDAATLAQVQSTASKLLTSVAGTDTITAVASPALTAYATGQMFYFVSAGANTGAVTLNVDSLGAKAVTRKGATALVAGEIASGQVCVVVYDGTRFQLITEAKVGDVVGPASATDTAVVRYDGTTGKLVKNTSNVTISDLGGLTVTPSAGGSTVFNAGGVDADFTIQGDTVASLFVVDASTDRIGVGTATPAAKLHVVDTDTTAQIIIENTDAGANNAPDLILWRNSASPATSDNIGNVIWRATATGGTAVDTWSCAAIITNATGGSGDLRWTNTTAEQMRLTNNGNLKIGGTASRSTTEGGSQLVLFNGTAPVGTLTNGVSFYSASGEARVMDAAGNSTLLSPHDQATNEWIFHSKHTPTGKVLRIDVEKMLRFINEHFGLDMVHEFVE